MITRYEITACHVDGRKFLVSYSPRRSWRGLIEALHAKTKSIESATGLAGSEHFFPEKTLGYTCKGWTFTFSGRTQLEAKSSPLPFIYDAAQKIDIPNPVAANGTLLRPLTDDEKTSVKRILAERRAGATLFS